jgi:hypothetical protein
VYDVSVICHRQIQMHFFHVNAKEWNVDRCHRKSPGADDWSRATARAVLLHHVKVWPPWENKRIFTQRERNLFTTDYDFFASFGLAAISESLLLRCKSYESRSAAWKLDVVNNLWKCLDQETFRLIRSASCVHIGRNHV